VTDFFNGFTLKGAKTSPSNATTSAPADSGVAREVGTLDGARYPSGQPDLVEARADQYRVAVLDAEAGEQEWLVWAANSGSIATLEGPAWTTTEGTGRIPQGGVGVLDTNATSGQSDDGSARIIVTDDGGRDVGGVVSIRFTRGDNGVQYLLTSTGGDFSFAQGAGSITLLPSAATLAATQPVDNTMPALSLTRGDRIDEVSYWVAAARFWWTRNDPYTRRFGWNGSTQKWEPYRGGAPTSLGRITPEGGQYTLDPRPLTATGSILPGSSSGDAYAMLRVGSLPDASSYPIVERSSGSFSGVMVVPDDLANVNYNFAATTPPLAGVVGSGAGKIIWNPSFILAYEGSEVWYLPRTFSEKSLGVVGSLIDAQTTPLFIAPIPGPGERPIIRLGNRQPLAATPYDTEADLAAATVPEGDVGFALSTGRIKLSPFDIEKADPGTRLVPNAAFDPLYLGAVVRYDGVTLNLFPQPLKPPVLLVDSAGVPVTSYDPANEVFIPDGVMLPGLGESGILTVPDGGGNPPVVGTVGPRPGVTGLVRKLASGIGDTLLFTQGRAVTNVVPVAFEDELPGDAFRIQGDTAYVALEKRTGAGSLVMLGSVPRTQLTGKPLYFGQGEFVPAVYTDQARLFSRRQDSFTFDGTEVFCFRIGAVTVVWLASVLGAGTFSASVVAASLQSAITTASAPGSASVLSGRLVLAHNLPLSGWVSIGFGTGGELDLSGCRALGFLPGWFAGAPGDTSATDLNWVADYGGEFGFYRSPRDLDGSQGIASYRDKHRIEDRVLTDSISGTPFQFLDQAPREDIAGYDEGVFFTLSAEGAPGAAPVVQAPLRAWSDVQYLFEQRKFAWLGAGGSTGQIQEAVAGLNLGASGVVPETFYAPLGGFLRLSEGGAFEYLDLDADFVLPQDGATGEAVLVTRIGDLRQVGFRARFTDGTNLLTDTSASFSSVAIGDRLKLTSGDAQGFYRITGTLSTSLTVSPPFPEGDGGRNVSYEIYKGAVPNAINPSIAADVVYEEFDHLAEEPFEIRVLTKLGDVGSALADADVSKSLERGRSIAVRVTQTGVDIPITILSRSVLGAVANDALRLPSSGDRFSEGAFNLRVGTREFTQGVDLLPVTVFSSDPGATIEYLMSGSDIGELKFGSAVLDEFAAATVTYVETLLPSTDIETGTAEIDPDTGAVSLSSVDLTPTGAPVYFVEQLSTEGTTDLKANPILGSFTFLANPIREGQLVEAVYYRANQDTGDLYLDVTGAPVQVREFLPLYVRAEVATRVSSQLYSFNPTGRTTDASVDPIVYAGARQLTYGVPTECTVDFSRNTISLNVEWPADTKVTISYAVYEAFGGETSYTVSIPPVWRPPFRLDKDQAAFLLDEDRTGDVLPGKTLRVGSFTTYIRNAVYDAASDTTLVGVFPAPPVGVGSLNPGQNALSLISDRPVTSTVDPFGSPVSISNADGGFLPTMAVAFGATPRFEPVSRGQVEIKFEGDLGQYAVAGHLLELFGHPFAIVKSELSSDGRVTTITVTSPFPRSFEWTSVILATALRISTRPIYPVGATQFVGSGAFLATEPFEVVLFEDNLTPGRTLALGRDYQVSEGTGAISFIEPRQTGIEAGQSLVFNRTKIRQVAPFMSKGQVQYPRLSSSFAAIDPPSSRNGRLGGVLQATYTFESPDAFFVQALPFQSYVGEVSLALQKEATAAEPSNGPVFSSGASKSNSDKGRVGLVSERQNLIDRDRAARAFLGFYNAVVSSFEQVEETLDGSLIGERDGKLRLYVGKDDPWVPPGYEDPITGALNPRVLWFEAWTSARVGLPVIRLLATDPIIEPLTAATDSNGRPTGQYQEASSFDALLNYQQVLVKNDVDDVVLTGRTGTQRRLSGFITFKVLAYGQYSPLSEAGPFSRLFPERTEGFTTLGPGLDGDETTGVPGVYSAGKLGFDPLGFLYGAPFSIRSTTGKSIGSLENPVLGQIQNVLGIRARDRRARARVWMYSATGFPTVDAASTGRPSIIATPLPLSEFPLLSDTGLPDTSRLASESVTPTPTGFYDLLTGDPDLHTPPFAVGDQLAVGYPAGNSQELGYTGTTIVVGASSRYAGVFVDAILSGCVITLKSKSSVGADVPITDPAFLVALTGNLSGDPFSPERGDTLFVIPGTGSPLPATSDPPTIAELQGFAAGLPEYRTGTDLNFDSRTGSITDATLPSFSDPTLFGLKEITGQRPPAPLSTLEAVISFQQGSRLPIRVPALSGGKTLDSGDYSLPYYGSSLSELELLGDASAMITDLLRADSLDPPPATPAQVLPAYAVEALYPDETLGADGEVSTTNPNTRGVLTTEEDLARGTSSGAYPPPPGHAGVGDVGEYDLLLIEEGSGTPGVNGFPAGATGIHSIGTIRPGTQNQIEPPRFTTPVNEGSPFTHLIANAIAWVGYPAYASGVVVTETVGAFVETTLDVSSVGTASIVFDDGSGGGAFPIPIGGINDIFASNGKSSLLFVSLINKSTGQFVSSTTIIVAKLAGGSDILSCAFEVSGDGGATYVPVLSGGFFAETSTIVLRTNTPIFDFTPYNPTILGPGITATGGFHDFTLSVSSEDSVTSSIESDRLTFHERIDLRSALPRDFIHPSSLSGSPMGCALLTRKFRGTVLNSAFTTFVTDNTSNDISFVNAGAPFTFPARTWITPSGRNVGTFDANVGTLRVLGFEGHGNVPLDATNVTFTAIPSTRQDADGPIYNGLMLVGQTPTPITSAQFVGENSFAELTSYAGGLSKVQPGDIAVIRGVFDPALGVPNPNGIGKAGTYLIRGAIEETSSGPGHRLDLSTTITSDGSTSGWLDFEFPEVVSFDGSHLTATSLLPVSLRDAAGNLAPSYAFPSTGRVYIILNAAAVESAGACVSALYASLDTVGVRFFGLSDYRDGLGNAITLGAFTTAATSGRKISGMTLLPVLPSGEGVAPNLPSIHFGLTPPGGAEFFYGMREITVARIGTVTYSGGAGTLVGIPPAAGQMAAYQKVKVPSTTFRPLTAPVYDEIAGAIDISRLNWTTVHGTGPGCVLPGDQWGAQYHAKQGIFVEPSFPVSGNDLAATRVNVVDSAHSLPASEIGTRAIGAYASPGGVAYELAQVEVRRIRRFHSLLNNLTSSISRLRFVYEVRRGIVDTFTGSGSVGVLVAEPVDTSRLPEPLTGGGATQLGDFTVSDVGVRPGDQVRFLDSLGEVFAEAEVKAVETDGKTLSISKNALPGVVPGIRFEVYLRTAPIPHEQSCEELLALATDEVLLDRRADLITQEGGQVPYITDADPQVAYDQSINVLTDTDGSIDFAALGVQEGDVLIIDPAGLLRGPTGSPATPEWGARPFGDNGVIDRGGSVYASGGPQRTDDNRGYYRITSVTPTSLEVSLLGGTLAGNRGSGDVVFDGMYAVYPTVHGSNLSGAGNGREGQMDLRPTAFANGSNSFLADWLSIAPFSYRIVRPTQFLSEETVELILAMRERMLSWIEELRGLFESDKGGTYYIFQRDRHITDLGDPSDPLAGLGVMFDAYVAEIEGRVLVSPFANTRDCLSILDRRFWGLDFRLDYLRPPFAPADPPYADFAGGVGRPVLPDRIEEALQQRDRLRDSRWAWLTMRTDRVSGTLEAIRRFDRELPRRRAEQERLLTMVKGVKTS